MTLTSRIASPCVGICAVHGRTQRCVGCNRTLAEIAKWSRFSDEERAAIMAELPAREPPPKPA